VVEQALQDANAYDFVSALPYRWDTSVGRTPRKYDVHRG
jgi:hypothetical protein